MSLFIPPIHCYLTPSEWDTFSRSVDEPEGGMGELWYVLLQRATHGSLEVEDSELTRMYGYAYDYGSGGYQARFKALLSAAFRAGWCPP